MAKELPDVVFLCPKCLIGQEAGGNCPYDGTELIECRPGSKEDPQRRPIMQTDGRVLTRAPKWWLKFTVSNLMRFIEPRVNRPDIDES
jgi:hypothetical protein